MSLATHIQQTNSNEDLIRILSEQLSGSELNSLLLEVFARRADRLTAPQLLKHYQSNRFVQPAESNYITLLEKAIETLKISEGAGFIPVHLSPLVPFGTCSAMGTVDQDKVVSSLRNCEVLSDATNALALHIASQRKHGQVDSKQLIRHSAVQRHVRAQPITMKGFSPHFTIGCLVSSGMDTGDYQFERQSLLEHFKTLTKILQGVFGIRVSHFKIQKRSGYPNDFVERVATWLQREMSTHLFHIDTEPKENNYYQGIQFKVVVELAGKEFEIADGGFVDWTQKLLSNKKERYCISGFGLELLIKFNEGSLG